MRFFNLPDLGEGIPEADIIKWHINEGDEIKEDQVMVSVETAKAIVEVPSPQTGVIARLCGKPGDTILTGEPLVEFISDEEDAGTVVGKLVSDDKPDNDESFIIGAAPVSSADTQKSGSRDGLRALAGQMNMNLDDLPARNSSSGSVTVSSYTLEKPELLKGVRKHMARIMAESHASVVPVTLFDDADIHHWSDKEDITVRLIQAVIHACHEEPALNAWFDGASMSRDISQSVDFGLAVDSEEGLFVPVIRKAERLNKKQLRERVNVLRESVKNRSISPADLQGASISLSNFGVFAGKYATPVVVPPMVSILGIGRLREELILCDGQPVNHRMLPLSLSFDHRAVTGGEATRFLHSIIQQLQS